MRKFLLVGVTMLLSLTTFASLSAGLATVVVAQEPTADQVNHVAKKLYCPVCPNTPLDVCETQACEDWRALIRDKLAAGEDEQTIIDYFVAQYGVEVLAAPPRQGFGALVWTLPLVAAIRHLDFDYQAGVVAEEDYLPQRQALAAQAVVLMQEMDRQVSAVASPSGRASGQGLEQEIEATVQARRAGRVPVEQPVQVSQAGSTARALEDEIEAAVQALRRDRRGVATARFSARVDHGCPACGGEVSPGDRFCAMCGARLGLFCRRCGRAAEPDDRFCGGCGLALREEANAVALRQHWPCLIMKRYADHGRYLLPFLLFLILSSSALAQSPSETTIAVEGQITNGTTGAPVPANLPLMLHTYEGETMTARVDFTRMTDGTSDSRGRFLFENVAAAPGRAFEAMVTYQDVSYFSPLLVPAQGQGTLELPVQIYETGSDLAALQVEQNHVLLDFSPGAMQVSQVYILSNYGDRTVVGNEGTAPLRFSLPAGATDLSFDGDPEGTRFVRLEDGFADRAPVRPGRATHQIVVGYILPYDGQLQVELPVDYSTAGVNVLLPDVGVTLSGAGLGPAEERLVQGQRYLIYRGASPPSGGSLTLELSGQPGTTLSAPTPVEATASRGRLPVLLGGVALSLILIAAGILWWWRWRWSAQPDLIPSAYSSDELETLLQAIADLDDAREAGTIEEEAYREKRTRLRTQAVALLAERRQAT